MFEGFERGIFCVDDVDINYVKAGKGPPLLLLHGFPQNMSMWASVAPKLAESFTVVCADLRGYGDSGKPLATEDGSNYSFRRMGEDNFRLMESLGFESFHLVGHDRGGRTGHRLALDRPEAIISLSVLDIVPTYEMFALVNKDVAGAYWHWYFLSQPSPFPEHMIGLDPDNFYETCLVGWGASVLEDFNQDQLNDYRRCWQDTKMIYGSCADYRAAPTIDMQNEQETIDQLVECPTLVFFGSKGTMAECFDLPELWRKRCRNVYVESLPGGHFFVDHFPVETAKILKQFLTNVADDN